MNITDHSPAPLEFAPTPAERERAAHLQAQLRFLREVRNIRDQARALYEQAERDYHHSNPTLDGQA